MEFRGESTLVLGYGGIGVQVVERAHAFGMDVFEIKRSDILLTLTL